MFENKGQKAVSDIVITITPAQNTQVNQNNKWNLVYDANAQTYPQINKIIF